MGFGYDDWRGVFYPRSTKPGEQLAFYARHFDAVEIDSSFHAAPSPERFTRWAEQVPASFRFTIKTPRAITHDGQVGDGAEPMKQFIVSARSLGEKLAVILIQYPATLSGRAWPQVARFLDSLPKDIRFAVEFRQRDWYRTEVFDGLWKRGIAIVNADLEQDSPPPVVTSDFAYLRLIGLHNQYQPTDHERVDRTDRLRWWREQVEAIGGLDHVWCVIGNDWAGYSIATTDRMRTLLGQRVTTTQERMGTLF